MPDVFQARMACENTPTPQGEYAFAKHPEGLKEKGADPPWGQDLPPVGVAVRVWDLPPRQRRGDSPFLCGPGERLIGR